MSDWRSNMASFIARAIVLACVLVSTPTIASIGESAERIDSRIEFVGKLINDSSASRQVDESGNDLAMQRRSDALNYYQEAIEARNVGELQNAADGLDRAIQSMYAAVDATRRAEKGTNDREDKYDERVASINALMEAHERITLEKGKANDHAALLDSIATDMSAAEEFHNSGNTEKANNSIDMAYEKVRHSVEVLRQGETLVRELKFANAEEEYIYELDRNDTHQMLINLLVDKRTDRPDRKQRAEKLVETALALREKAESLANEGKFDEAIHVLEESTIELVKAIRGAGVYIPG